MIGRVPEDLDGERADKVVAVLAGLSRSQARAVVEAGEARRRGMAVAADERLAAGDELEIQIRETTEGSLQPEPVPFEVRYEDPHLLVVDKPAGVVVHPGNGRRRGTLAAGLAHRYPDLLGVGGPVRSGLVHRLDRDTSGLLLVGRDDAVHAALTGALARRQIGRTYLAMVGGVPELPSGTVDAPLDRDPRRPTRRAVIATGRPARTNYRVAAASEDQALLEVSLDTGRTHQIRVHLAAIGHPVVGDPVYGRRIKGRRQFLHTARLGFPHPVTATEMEVRSPLPADLADVVAELGPPSSGQLP